MPQLKGDLKRKSKDIISIKDKRPRGMLAFLRRVSEGMSPEDAIADMGPSYRDNMDAYLDHPDAGWIMAENILRLLVTRVAPRGVQRLIELVDSKDERVALAAIKMALDKTILPVPVNPAGETPSDDLSSLSADQLQEKILRLEQSLEQRADSAKNVTPMEPDSTIDAKPVLSDSQVADMFG